jgi:hypothetical protein
MVSRDIAIAIDSLKPHNPLVSLTIIIKSCYHKGRGTLRLVNTKPRLKPDY